ncbi:Pentatricopeptide repeat-containing protein [Camellia lanceoleosa]|uniref:Pentatricopeptide repeat-containing protein n=1 Tax=Camellia lanceoleosa TaxID=1840588 RepID=A0ACC0IV74_9ERIC|nr:Pentatricopeptide repeat-containing protein [Camellia lanceoleosa]
MRSGEAPKALTYKLLVRAFWEEGKVDEAVKVVRDMEQRGVFGIACVYYELACCLCNNGRWQEAMLEVEKLKKLPRTKPLEVTFTGMIMSSMDGGRVHDCISIFQNIKDHFVLDIGIINAVLKSLWQE